MGRRTPQQVGPLRSVPRLEERFDPFRDSADYTTATQLNLRDPTVFIKCDAAHQTTAG
jgi:hypothetical protein